MAMKNEYSGVQGIRRTVEYYPGYPPDVTLSAVPDARRRGLSNVITYSGDFKTPTRHQYMSYRSNGWNGSSMTIYYPGRATQFTGYQSKTLSPSLPDPLTVPDSCFNKAYAELVEKLRGNTDLSVDMVQWRQVKDMVNLYKRGVSGLLRSVAHAGRTLDLHEVAVRQREHRLRRQGRLSRFSVVKFQRWEAQAARRVALQLAQARAEYVYGWKPLASTLVGMGEALRNPPNDTWIKVRGRARERSNYGVSITSTYSNEKRVVNGTYFCTIEGYFVPLSSQLLANLARISSLNPVSLAWEVVPYSFVVDWFVDIGGWLRNVESAFVYGSSWKGGRISQGHKFRSDLRNTVGRSDFIQDISGYAEQTCFSRLNVSSMPMPKLPVFKMDFGLDRTLNALAIGAITANRVDNFIKRELRR